MTTHKSMARKSRQDGKPLEAGDHFTVAAYRCLGDDIPWKRPHSVFRAERSMADAALCYRLGNQLERSKNRCQQGTLVGADVIDGLATHFEPPALYLNQGAIHEYMGDLKSIALDRTAHQEYADAIEYYENAGHATPSGKEFTLIDIEELNDYSVGLFNEIAWVTDAAIETVSQTDDEMTLGGWVEYKKQHLPDLIDHLVDIGVRAYSEDS